MTFETNLIILGALMRPLDFTSNKIKMLFSSLSISATLYNFLVESSTILEIESKDIVALTGEELVVEEFDERVSTLKVLKLWQAIETLSPYADASIRIARLFTPQKAGVIGELFMKTRTLFDSVEMMQRYLSLMITNITFEYEIKEDTLIFRIDSFPRPLIPASILECYIFICYFWALEYIQIDRLPIIKVSFSYPKLPYMNIYQKLAPNTPIYFNANENCVVLEKSMFEEVNKKFSPSAFKLLTRYADELKSLQCADKPFSNKVATQIQEYLHSESIHLCDLASILNISPSTLKRKLKSEGTSFKILLDSVKKELSLLMIQEEKLRIEDIAFFLGYSEYSSFYRAFKRWHGLSPAHFRDESLAT